MRKILLAVATAAALIGCVGGIDNSTPGGPSGDDTTGDDEPGVDPAKKAVAKQAFNESVYPILSAKCVACHSVAGPSGNVSGFVATSATDGYITATGYTSFRGNYTAAGAPVLTKIAAGHQNVTYTADDISKITAWLDKEIAARTGTTGDDEEPTGESPAAATTRLTKEWSGCLTLTNFQTANMKAWGNMRANNSACKTCHINCEYGECASDTDTPFFTQISTNKYYMAQYFTADLSQGVANAKMVINTTSFTNVGTGKAPHLEHPRFQLQGSTGMAALQKLYDLTMASKTANTCGTPTLTN